MSSKDTVNWIQSKYLDFISFRQRGALKVLEKRALQDLILSRLEKQGEVIIR